MQNSFTTQPELFVTASDLDSPILNSLDDTEALLDWSEIENVLSSIYSANTGRPSYPLLTLFRSLLLGIWYKLSDVELANCLYRDLLFRKFCHLELTGNVPEASTLGRFRNKLVELNLWDSLLEEINSQLASQNIIMTQGRINIIDATPIEASQSGSGKGKDGQPKKDPEAGWHVKNDSRGRQKSTYGYSVHTGVDEDGFIHSQCVTAGNVHDSQERDSLILGDEAKLYADAAYSSKETRDTLEELGIEDQVQRKGYRNNPLSEQDKLRNAEIAVTRAGGERPFATYKTHYGLTRTRFMGLAKNETFFGLAAMAANIRKGARFLMLYGLPEMETTG
ncbi:IS5 family transposase [Marinomonas algicola]|uniref:IS5 family transposase n=1 Tax=Marinomonas algicola TaxID=2773454 RepID=UPI00174BD76A|nr:IS5 family transposase [Marinomonas algicola]